MPACDYLYLGELQKRGDLVCDARREVNSRVKVENKLNEVVALETFAPQICVHGEQGMVSRLRSTRASVYVSVVLEPI